MPLRPGWPEMVLLAALLLASASLFLLRFSTVLGNILRAKRDPGVSFGLTARRVRDFIVEVLLQAKVIRERPLAGIAHAFVFWGFCAFALVTLNHLAAGFGFAFVARDSGFGRFYFGLAAAFGVAVAVSIAGLFARRFIVRPKWLGETLSWESGAIAGLIFVLMASYLAAWWLPESSSWATPLWWAHTSALVAFLPLVPHTKHLHLVLSPFSVFFSRGGFAQISPLSGDEDFGLDTGKDVTRIAALQAYSCVECGRCTEHCPAYNTSKELNPKEIALGFRRYLNEYGPAGDQPLLGQFLSQNAAFQCTTCGACEYQCP